MIFDFNHIANGVLEFDERIFADEFDFDGENIKLLSDLKVFGECVKDDTKLDFSGTINVKAAAECTRCLDVIEWQLDLKFEAGYLTTETFFAAETAEIEETELINDVIPEAGIELKTVVREQILLSMPVQIYCKEDCKGLCETCGANLNLIDCNCNERDIDPRWASLLKIKN